MSARGCYERDTLHHGGHGGHEGTRIPDFFSVPSVVASVTAMALKPLVLKCGGELLDDPARLATVVGAIARIVAAGTPLVVVHGGGKEIDAAMQAAGIEKRQIDGLR